VSETKYDSDFIGFADDPKLNEDGSIRSWRLTLKENHLADLEKYKTAKGNVYITMMVAKSGKSMATVYNPRSEKAIADMNANKSQGTQQQTTAQPSQAFAESDDLPF
jgi:hypothetical protein